jgi:hypothetical protein
MNIHERASKLLATVTISLNLVTAVSIKLFQNFLMDSILVAAICILLSASLFEYRKVPRSPGISDAAGIHSGHLAEGIAYFTECPVCTDRQSAPS